MTPSSAATISGRTSPDSSASTSAPGTSWPRALDSAAKARVEALVVELGALEPGPRVDVRVGGVDAADEVERDLVLGLVAPERLEGAGEDHAAEVPEYRSDHGRRLYDGDAAARQSRRRRLPRAERGHDDQNDVDNP